MDNKNCLVEVYNNKYEYVTRFDELITGKLNGNTACIDILWVIDYFTIILNLYEIDNTLQRPTQNF